ncbi:uncharacterized protein LOC131323819 [Rhododendron vialii]|uniref:uncharacterized protein LOC131323819 n=1 Tax=Rhododendron vialii TaxID=182163 RepID=UPI00266059EB|nr:uncharacterized protein LOC131323819 [Rhododendron vialii]
MVNTHHGLGYDNGEPSNANPDLTQIMQAFITALNANRQNQNHNDGPMNRAQTMNEFCKHRPPTFHRDTNLVVAETWLNEVKMILRTLGITQDGDRVALATYQLKGEARYWWDLIEATHTIATMTFAKEQEFLNLKQRIMTVTQYAAKFEELSLYALTSIPTEDKKARRFDWGLTTARRAVVAQAFTTYAEVVKCALRLERHGEPQRGGQDIATIQCYNCQAMGHIRRNCPQPQRRRDESFGNQRTQPPE